MKPAIVLLIVLHYVAIGCKLGGAAGIALAAVAIVLGGIVGGRK